MKGPIGVLEGVVISCVPIVNVCEEMHSISHRQNNGRMNKSGTKKGTTQSESPQVQKDPRSAAPIMITIEKDTMKQPPRFRYETVTVAPSRKVRTPPLSSKGLQFHTMKRSFAVNLVPDLARTCFFKEMISSFNGSISKHSV